MFALSVLSCGREPTGLSPDGLRYSQPIAFNTKFPAGYLEYVEARLRAAGTVSGNLANQSAGDVVQFDRVRVVLRNPDGTIAKDTIISFPAGVTEIPVTLTIPIPASAPASGQPLTGSLSYLNGNDVVLESQDQFLITVLPSVGGNPNPPAPVVVNVPVVYVGPGSSATQIQILPSGLTINTGTPFTFTAIARDATGATVPGAPVIFESLNPAVATITNPASGAGVAGPTRGSTTIRASLIGGSSSSATLNVVSPPAALIPVSGGSQQANVNAQLPNPVIVQVNATDGGPAANVTVTFAAQNGGTVGTATVISGADGRAQTTWRLGPASGSQTLTATAPGLTGSPVTFTATANALQPTRLSIATQPPASVAAGTSFGIVVNVVDATGAITPTYTGTVTLALSGAATGVSLQGTTSVNAQAGIATFTDLRVTAPSTYAVTAASGALTAATTNTFQVVAGSANRLVFQNYPTGGATAGATLDAITVQVRDALNNPATTFTDPVTLAIASGPAGASITGNATVNAVAGLATFTGLSLRTAGQYSLSATGTGLTAAVGPAFAIATGPATQLSLESGGSQSAIGGATLPSPIVVKATDAFGNGIAGRTITFSPVSSSVSPTSAVTDAAGLAQTTWTIGSTAGTYTLNVAGAGLTPNPLAVTATATSTTGPGPAASLVFSQQPTSTTAGVAISPSLAVTAKDALGAVATGFTGNVTLAIGTNPGSGTLSGTLTVAAVAGVATFPGISIDKAGISYTLTANSGALTSATSLGFNIASAAPANVAVSAGNAQTGGVGTALGTLLAVNVTDAFGNPVSGATVNWATPSGGSFSPTSSATNALGNATSTWTLGSSAGSQSATATVGALTPVGFTATATPGVATTLVFVQQPSNVTAGVAMSPAVTVEARDASGNLDVGFSGSVTMALQTFPGGATIGGTTVVSAVAGVATFSNLRLPKAGSPYAIVATSGALNTGNSSNFNVTAAPAQNIGVASGNAPTQSALTGQPLTLPFVVVVTDSVANPISGVSVTWAVATGGGTLGGTTSTTDGLGQAQTTLTIGLAGPNTVTATNGALTGSPVTFTATGLSAVANAVWTGAVSNVWNLAGNWSPPSVPLATDAVLIQAGGTQPVLGANTTLQNLTIAPGATLDVGSFTLTITGSVDAGTTITGTGSVNLSGTGTLKGVIIPNVSITGAYALGAGVDSVTGNLDIGTGGSLTVGANALNVGGSFSTSGTGVLNMTTAGGVVTTYGNATFGGGASVLSDGVLQVKGNFAQTTAANTYAASGNHNTWLFGSTPGISFFDGTGTSRFAHLKVVQGNATISTSFFANTVELGASVITFATVNKATVRDTIIDPNDRWGVQQVDFNGTNLFVGNQLTGAGQIRFTGGATTALLGNTTFATAHVTVLNNTTLALGTRTLTVAGNFTTSGGGKLDMTGGSSLNIAGDAFFGGGSTTGLLTSGTITLSGNLTQTNGGSGTEFAPSISSLNLVLSGVGTQTISFADPDTVAGACTKSCIGDFIVVKSGGSVTFNSGAKIVGNMSMNPSAATTFSAIGAAGSPKPIVVAGTVNFGANLTSHVTRLALGGTPTFAGATTVDSIAFIGTSQTIPAGSYGYTQVKGTASLGGAVSMNRVNIGGTLTINGNTLTVTDSLRTSGTGTFVMNNAADVVDVGGEVVLAGGTSTASNGLLKVGGSFTEGGAAKTFVGSGSHVTRFVGAAHQSVNFQHPDLVEVPAGASACALACFANVEINKTAGRVNFVDGAKMMGNFTLVNAPDSVTAYARRITVTGSFLPTTNPAGGRIGLLSVGGATAGNAALMKVDTLVLWGAADADISPDSVLQVWGSNAIKGSVRSFKHVRVFGSGTLTFMAAATTINGDFSTNGGTNTFTQVHDSVNVHVLGNVNLTGGASAPAAGTLTVDGDFTTTGAAFHATGTHLLEIAGDGCTPQTITGSTPQAGVGVNHLMIGGSKNKVFSGDIRIVGDVALNSNLSSAITGPGATARIGGDFLDYTTIGADSGAWRVENTDFFGSNTINSGFMTTNVTISGGTVQFVVSVFCDCALRDGAGQLRVGSAEARRQVSALRARRSGAARGAAMLQAGGPASIVDPEYVQINGNVTVTGSSAVLNVGPALIDVFGNFGTASGGVLQMDDGYGYLFVTGNASFAGGSTTGKLTAGYIEVFGDFTEGGGATDAFAPTTDVETAVGAYGVLVEGGQVQAGIQTAPGRRPKLTAAQEAKRAKALGESERRAAARTAERAKRDTIRTAALTRRGVRNTARPTTRSVSRGGAQIMANTVMPSSITFAHPTTSWFGDLYLQGLQTNLGSNVLVTGRLESGISYSHAVTSASPRVLTSRGADVRNMDFQNTRWVLTDEMGVYSMDAVMFSSMDPTVDQFTFSGPGSYSCDGTCTYDLYYWTFSTVPTTGHYMNVNDTNGIASEDPPFLVYMVSPQPSPHGGKVVATNGAEILNWAASFNWTGASAENASNWFDDTNWSAGVVPSSSDDVTIPFNASGNYPLEISNDIYVHNLTIASGARLDLVGPTVHVYGDLSAPTNAQSITCGDGGYLTLGGSDKVHTVTGRFCNAYVDGTYKIAGQMTTDQATYIYGDLNVNGGRLDVGGFGGTGYGVLYTQSYGTLTMQNAADQVFVGTGGAWFEGGSTAGRLTAGTFTLVSSAFENSCLHALNPSAAHDAFAPSGSHKVIFSGPGNFAAKAEFYYPAESFINDAEIAPGSGMMLGSDVLVKGTLSRGAGSGSTIITTSGAQYLLYVSGLAFSSAQQTTVNNVIIRFDDGTANTTFDNVVFTGYTNAGGGALFVSNRSTGPLTFNGFNFSGAGFGATSTEHFVATMGAANITIAGATPASGTAGIHYVAGGGTISWP